MPALPYPRTRLLRAGAGDRPADAGAQALPGFDPGEGGEGARRVRERGLVCQSAWPWAGRRLDPDSRLPCGRAYAMPASKRSSSWRRWRGSEALEAQLTRQSLAVGANVQAVANGVLAEPGGAGAGDASGAAGRVVARRRGKPVGGMAAVCAGVVAAGVRFGV
jgi:hypothetical protein